MQILQICKQFPYPLKDGYSVAVTAIAKSLIDNEATVDLLSMNTTKHFVDLTTLPADYNDYRTIYTQKVNNNITAVGAFLNLFSPISYIISRFINLDFEEKLVDILQANKYDVVQLESVQLAPYIPIIRKYSTAKIAMRAHNVEFEIWERQIATTRFPLKRWYLQSQLSSFKQFEIQQLMNYDLLIAITKKDLQSFQKLGFEGNGIVIPVGIDLEKYQAKPLKIKPTGLDFSFIGSLDWMPNQEGVHWFLSKVWGGVRSEFPNDTFQIAGRYAPRWLQKLGGNGAIFRGEVASASDFILGYPVMIVPLFSGSGIRVKILEAMAQGRVVITTALGAEGIPAIHQQEILLAESAEEFLGVIRFCHQNPSKLVEIGKNARDFIIANFGNSELGHQLMGRLEWKI